MKLSKKIKADILRHAKAEYPNECCGVIENGVYKPCKNISPNPQNTFEIEPSELVSLNIQAIVHSHPNGNALPSDVDKIQMKLHDVPWIIAAYGIHSDGEEYNDIQIHEVEEEISLIGREYHHGLSDCYTLVRDYYKTELNIDLPDFKRDDLWWENENGKSLYIENLENAGFVKVDDLKTHDMILCSVGRTFFPNHALIYLGNHQIKNAPPTVGDNLIIHHQYDRLSNREIYGESWQKRTVMIVRHKELL